MKALSTLVAIFVSSNAWAQQPIVKNPDRVQYECLYDHQLHTGHELDIIRVSDNVVIQTLSLGTAPPDANGKITHAINVVPVAPTTYYVRMRSLTGAMRSSDSAPSNTWERVPGEPTRVEMLR
jgi:hypothetical protein